MRGAADIDALIIAGGRVHHRHGFSKAQGDIHAQSLARRGMNFSIFLKPAWQRSSPHLPRREAGPFFMGAPEGGAIRRRVTEWVRERPTLTDPTRSIIYYGGWSLVDLLRFSGEALAHLPAYFRIESGW